jgi:hypothetical protein
MKTIFSSKNLLIASAVLFAIYHILGFIYGKDYALDANSPSGEMLWTGGFAFAGFWALVLGVGMSFVRKHTGVERRNFVAIGLAIAAANFLLDYLIR